MKHAKVLYEAMQGACVGSHASDMQKREQDGEREMAVKAAERENKRAPLNMRTTAKLRDALEKEASKADRSLAQEVEARLERSFQEDDLLAVFVGDQTHVQLMMRVISATIRRVEAFRGDRFVDSYATRWHCRNAVEQVLDLLMDADFGEPKPDEGGEWSEEDRKRLNAIGRRIARDTLKDFGVLTTAPPHVTTVESASAAFKPMRKVPPAQSGDEN